MDLDDDAPDDRRWQDVPRVSRRDVQGVDEEQQQRNEIDEGIPGIDQRRDPQIQDDSDQNEARNPEECPARRIPPAGREIEGRRGRVDHTGAPGESRARGHARDRVERQQQVEERRTGMVPAETGVGAVRQEVVTGMAHVEFHDRIVCDRDRTDLDRREGENEQGEDDRRRHHVRGRSEEPHALQIPPPPVYGSPVAL